MVEQRRKKVGPDKLKSLHRHPCQVHEVHISSSQPCSEPRIRKIRQKGLSEIKQTDQRNISESKKPLKMGVKPFGSHANPKVTHQLLRSSRKSPATTLPKLNPRTPSKNRKQGHVDSRFGWPRATSWGSEGWWRRSRGGKARIQRCPNPCGGPCPSHEMISAMRKRRPEIRRPTSCRIGGGPPSPCRRSLPLTSALL